MVVIHSCSFELQPLHLRLPPQYRRLLNPRRVRKEIEIEAIKNETEKKNGIETKIAIERRIGIGKKIAIEKKIVIEKRIEIETETETRTEIEKKIGIGIKNVIVKRTGIENGTRIEAETGIVTRNAPEIEKRNREPQLQLPTTKEVQIEVRPWSKPNHSILLLPLKKDQKTPKEMSISNRSSD